MKRLEEPFFWGLFSAGGVFSAMFLPIQALLFALLIPLGIIHPSYEHLHTLLANPITRLYLFVLCSLSLFHWAHRFRFTLFDGLQIKHLNELIFTMCYGGAVAGTLYVGYVLLRVH